MTQKVFSQEWAEDWVSRSWPSDPERGWKQIRRYRVRVQHAMDLLDETQPGQKVCFEGSCPSGSTYDDWFVWDGTPETREAIAEKAMSRAGFNAWAGWLVREAYVTQSLFAAKMRTG